MDAMLQANGRRVLIVDDEPSVRNILRRFLEAEGYETQEAESGERAQERLKAGRFDAVLSDLSMPGAIDGMTLAGLVHREFPDTEVILMTGFPDIEVTIQALKEGVLDFLVKPVNRDNLLAVMRRWSRERALREALKDANAVLESCVEGLLTALENLCREELAGTAKKRVEFVIEKARKLEALAASLKKVEERKVESAPA